MDILMFLLIILIILVIALIFIVLNIKKEQKTGLGNEIKYDIKEILIEKNNDTKTDLIEKLNESSINISDNISEFKLKVKEILNEDITRLIDKVDNKLKESNEISNDSKKSLNEFKDKLEKDLDEDIDRLIEKVDNKFTGSDKNIQEFRLELQKSIYDNLDKLTKKVEEKLESGNLLDKDIKEGINLFKESVKNNITKDILELSNKVELRLKEGFETTDKTFKELIERLAIMEKTQENIIKLSEDIMGLQKILSDKKSRGSFGELRLEQVLNNVYGDSGLYKMQYLLSNGKLADSIVYINDKEKIVCIDSKFPLENYLKYIEDPILNNKKSFIADVKKHIDDISNKYIIEGETLNVAMMFIPSESIFMEIYSNFEKEILNYAYEKRVWIVSQKSLMIYISTVQLSSINYKKNKNAETILMQLNAFSDEFNRYNDRWLKLQKDFEKIEKDFNEVKITSEKITSKFNTIKNMIETEE